MHCHSPKVYEFSPTNTVFVRFNFFGFFLCYWQNFETILKLEKKFQSGFCARFLNIFGCLFSVANLQVQELSFAIVGVHYRMQRIRRKVYCSQSILKVIRPWCGS